MRAAVALLAAFTLVTACGGSNVGAGPASSAGLLKPGALVYWQTVSDPDSAQWEQAEDLLARFPDGDRWLAQLKRDLQDEGVTWEEDVKPALGPVVDVVVYDGGGRKSPAVVGLTNPEDKDKLLALVRKLNKRSDEPAVTRVVGDWVAISDREESIDAALKEQGGQTLADDDTFNSALEGLPDDALSHVYVDPARAIEFGADKKRNALSLLGLDALDFAGAWVKAKEDAAELAVTARGEGTDRLFGTGQPYSSELLDKVPDDAFAFLSFQGDGLRRQLEAIRGNSLFAKGLRELEREYGIELDEVLPLLAGEVAFYARPGLLMPEFTLLLATTNEVGTRAAVERVLRRVPDEPRLSVRTLDGIVVVSTAHDPADDLGESGDKLPDEDAFKDALEAAEVPEQYTGLAYVDLTKVAGLIAAFADSAEVRRNLEPLRSLVAFGTKAGDEISARAVLEID
jgi:hypothetical protein